MQKLKGSEDEEVSSDSDDDDMMMIRQTIQTKKIITPTQEMHFQNDTIVNKETESATRLVIPVATDTTTQILPLTTSRDGSTSTEPPINTIHTPQADEDRLWLTVPLPSSSNSAESITSRSDQQNSDLNGQTMYLSPEDTQLGAGNKMDDSSNNICQEDVNSLEDDANDETFQPGQDITPLTRRIQPARNRRQPARYPAKEYNIAGITVLPKTINSKDTARTRKGHNIQARYFGLNYWQLCILILYMMIIPFGSAIRVVSKETDLGTMFGPGHICGSAGHHTMYIALPDIPCCEWEDSRTKNVENVLVTPFFPRTFSDPIEAYGCQVEIMTITTFMGFFGTESVLNREKFYRKLNVRECREEMANLDQGATTLKALGHDTFTNDTSSLTFNYYWCCKEHVFTRYRIITQKLKVRFNFHNKHVLSSTYKMEGCLMDDNYCELPMVTVIWETNSNDICPIKEGTNY